MSILRAGLVTEKSPYLRHEIKSDIWKQGSTIRVAFPREKDVCSEWHWDPGPSANQSDCSLYVRTAEADVTSWPRTRSCTRWKYWWQHFSFLFFFFVAKCALAPPCDSAFLTLHSLLSCGQRKFSKHIQTAGDFIETHNYTYYTIHATFVFVDMHTALQWLALPPRRKKVMGSTSCPAPFPKEFPCLRGFSAGTQASSRSLKTC